MPTKKILFVITKGSPFGGAQRYVYDLATSAPKEFEVAVACGNGNSLPEALGAEGLKVIRLESLEREVDASKDWSAFKELVKIIEEEKPDIVHLNSSKIGFLGALAVLFVRISYFVTRNSPLPSTIFTAHGWAFNESNRSQSSRLIYFLAHYLTVLFSSSTIAVSKKAKGDIAWLPFIMNKIRVIYNGVSKFKLKTKKEARLILSGEEHTKKIIIFSMSELHNNKGIDIALRGLARLPEKIGVKILYCIAGEGEEREHLESIAAEMNLNNVRFLGFVPNARELLAGADIFLLPSRTEALPYSLLEAGMAGMPIIATSVGGISEIIDDMRNGILIHPRDPREIAEAIIYMIENGEKRKMFREKIRETVSYRFSKEVMVSETYSLYQSLTQ